MKISKLMLHPIHSRQKAAGLVASASTFLALVFFLFGFCISCFDFIWDLEIVYCLGFRACDLEFASYSLP
ncbi:MAG: hypothetical protein A3F68_11825 [Acidobacteria bacterium RIFCSPLOWO2_12_FULL_54_10]|nr:MAG: hypothetical protein A3F68_11825 [Acidobacteria bacterium RIFCSPLOWO2_12_FULL_54_10]